MGGVRDFLRRAKRRLLMTRLSPSAQAVLAARLTYLRPERFLRIEQAAKRTRNTPGDIMEFGVALGGSAIVLDDYHDYGGCRTAVDEFLAKRRDYVMEDGTNPILRRL